MAILNKKENFMNKILNKKALTEFATLMEVEAPLIAKKAKPGQFIILRVDENSERIPLTIADYNIQKGTITIIFQIVGTSTINLNKLQVNDYIYDFVGPLGNPTQLDGIKKAIVIGGGVGCAIAYPIVKKLYENKAQVYSIIGFRNKDLVILEEEFNAKSFQLITMTDDGSYKEKGRVTEALIKLLDTNNDIDEVIAIGPLIMMKSVCEITKSRNIKTTVSMNPIMIDGTGMCGGCRITVDGKMKFACIDGPDFDGALVDFDEAMERNKLYNDFEKHKREESCNLLRQGESNE